MRGGIRLALLLLGSFYIASQSFAEDQQRGLNGLIKGVFRGVGSNNCMESQGGFAPDLTFVVNGFVGKYQENFVSTAVFPGDGTMTDSVRGASYFQGDANFFPGNFAAGTFVSTCQYTIDMNPNRSFKLKGGCNGTLPKGPGAGLGSIVDGLVTHGQLSDDGNTIIVGSPEPNANTLTLSSGYVAQRLCGTSATYLRVR
jgi:hypothetical protein